MRAIDVAVAQLAREQAGVVARSQLFALGMADNSIAARVDAGGFRRMAHGVYALTSAPPGYASTVMASVLAHRRGVVARRWAAAWWDLHGFSVDTVWSSGSRNG